MAVVVVAMTLASSAASVVKNSPRRAESATSSACVEDDWLDFWSWHVLNAYFTGAANKDLANEQCDVGFVAYYCFGQDKSYSDFNSEEHIEGNVIEYLHVYTEQPWAQYMSCCPPGSKTNPGAYYRCNSWTGEANDNLYITGLPSPQVCRSVCKGVGQAWERSK